MIIHSIKRIDYSFNENRCIMAKAIKIIAVSNTRWRASAAEKRLHGGSTVTEFYVTRVDTDETDTFTGYGKTPGERKTFAIAQARKMWGL